MQKPFWLNYMAELLGDPPAQKQRLKKLEKAKKAIKESFGIHHRWAADTCLDVLETLWEIAEEKKTDTVRDLSQKSIADRCRWSASTIGRYTRKMEEIGLLRISRSGLFQCNEYYFTFLEDTAAVILKTERGEACVATREPHQLSLVRPETLREGSCHHDKRKHVLSRYLRTQLNI